jgi:four helix bundle protein
MKIERFEDIEAWQDGRGLTKGIYDAVNQNQAFSKDWGLKDQITRASGSVMHNIAEGFDAGSTKEFIRFLGYSQRSCSEVQSELYVALDQKYITQKLFDDLYDQAKICKSKVGGFIRYLKSYDLSK